MMTVSTTDIDGYIADLQMQSSLTAKILDELQRSAGIHSSRQREQQEKIIQKVQSIELSVQETSAAELEAVEELLRKASRVMQETSQPTKSKKKVEPSPYTKPPVKDKTKLQSSAVSKSVNNSVSKEGQKKNAKTDTKTLPVRSSKLSPATSRKPTHAASKSASATRRVSTNTGTGLASATTTSGGGSITGNRKLSSSSSKLKPIPAATAVIPPWKTQAPTKPVKRPTFKTASSRPASASTFKSPAEMNRSNKVPNDPNAAATKSLEYKTTIEQVQNRVSHPVLHENEQPVSDPIKPETPFIEHILLDKEHPTHDQHPTNIDAINLACSNQTQEPPTLQDHQHFAAELEDAAPTFIDGFAETYIKCKGLRRKLIRMSSDDKQTLAAKNEYLNSFNLLYGSAQNVQQANSSICPSDVISTTGASEEGIYGCLDTLLGQMKLRHLCMRERFMLDSGSQLRTALAPTNNLSLEDMGARVGSFRSAAKVTTGEFPVLVVDIEDS